MVMPLRLRDKNNKPITQRVVVNTHAGMSRLSASVAMLTIYETMQARHDDVRSIEIERTRITIVLYLIDIRDRDQDRWLDEVRDAYEVAINRAHLPDVAELHVKRSHGNHSVHLHESLTLAKPHGGDFGQKGKTQWEFCREKMPASTHAIMMEGTVEHLAWIILTNMSNISDIFVDKTHLATYIVRLRTRGVNNPYPSDSDVTEAQRLIDKHKPDGVILAVATGSL